MKAQTISGLALASVLIGISLCMQGGEAHSEKTPENLQVANTPTSTSKCPELLNHSLNTLEGVNKNLCDYQGQVLLVVNTASLCGHTPQYEGLQQLYERYGKQGFSVLGFPANHFGKQEPGTDKEIKAFCESQYKVSFPMFSKTEILGDKANPLYQQLIQSTGQKPVWNFHKYLVDRQGKKILSFGSSTQPNDPKLIQALEKMLAQKK